MGRQDPRVAVSPQTPAVAQAVPSPFTSFVRELPALHSDTPSSSAYNNYSFAAFQQLASPGQAGFGYSTKLPPECVVLMGWRGPAWAGEAMAPFCSRLEQTIEWCGSVFVQIYIPECNHACVLCVRAWWLRRRPGWILVPHSVCASRHANQKARLLPDLCRHCEESLADSATKFGEGRRCRE